MAFAYLNKESGKWIVGWKDARGRQQRKTTPLKEREGRKAALRIAQQLEREAWEVSQGLKKERAPDVTLLEAVEAYLAALPSDYSSRKDLEGRLRNFVLKGLKPDTLARDVKPADVMALLSSLKSVRKSKDGEPKPLSPQTRENVRMAGQGLFTFLKEKAHLVEGDNPFKEAGAVRVPKREVLHFEAHHLPLLMAELKPEHQPIVAAAIMTGARLGELRVALKRNYHRREGYLLLHSGGRTGTTKGGRERRVPVPRALALVLAAQAKTPGPYLFPRPGTAQPYGKTWKAGALIRSAMGRAGLVEGYEQYCRSYERVKGCGGALRTEGSRRQPCPKCGRYMSVRAIPLPLRFKHLRSTWGTLAYAATGDIRLVQAVLGHADVSTTEAHYARALPAHLAAGSERVAQALDFTTKAEGGGK